ncbi:hypothetical protein K435DRAFT_973538 [Dendrothele bispora CBS 962.96]|uniref:Uncharacterized protein n=1 Tax=Dendrothele bispora (strain CBS 962.96) TaxID=1314807 RepID=A0A4S8KRX8_DENBC|nr:hypothetical protein K435DRAFT_973538 [Dendrothele bispora CBS 962.96]
MIKEGPKPQFGYDLSLLLLTQRLKTLIVSIPVTKHYHKYRHPDHLPVQPHPRHPHDRTNNLPHKNIKSVLKCKSYCYNSGGSCCDWQPIVKQPGKPPFVEPYTLKHMSISYTSRVHPHSVIDGNEESTPLNSPRNSINATVVTTSALTERQIQLRDETEALREQMKILQRAVLSSNVERQREIAKMGAHIQRLEIGVSERIPRATMDQLTVYQKYAYIKCPQDTYIRCSVATAQRG